MLSKFVNTAIVCDEEFFKLNDKDWTVEFAVCGLINILVIDVDGAVVFVIVEDVVVVLVDVVVVVVVVVVAWIILMFLITKLLN